jgi:hypothetical protein
MVLTHLVPPIIHELTGSCSAKKSDLIANFFEAEQISNAEAAATFFVAETSPARWAKGEVEPTGLAASILWTLGALKDITEDWDHSEEEFVQRLEQMISDGLVTVEALDSAMRVYSLLKKRLRNKKWISKVIIQHQHKREREKLLQEIESLKTKLDESKPQEMRDLQTLVQNDGDDEDVVHTE